MIAAPASIMQGQTWRKALLAAAFRGFFGTLLVAGHCFRFLDIFHDLVKGQAPVFE